MLVDLFNLVMNAESRAVITDEFCDITNNDMHILEAIGTESMQTVSAIARKRNVTVGTLTVSLNNLLKKGYIRKEKSSADRRVVLVTLTDRGRQAYLHHMNFHKAMIRAALEGLNDNEIETLKGCLEKLKDFFEGC